MRPARPSEPSSRRASQRWRRSASRSRSSSAARRSARGDTAKAVMPHDHGHVLADWHKAGARAVAQAIEAAAAARREWASWPWEDRAAVFLRAAELLATTWRATLNAATMLGQSKTAFQAEIDSAAELVDFWRFNPHYAQELYARAAALDHGDVEPARLPAARGLRLRGDAVQLHLDRRQPADRARADGQHGRVEAGLVGDPERLLHHEAARGRGPAAGRHQLRPRRRRGRSPTSCSTTATSPASTSPARPRSSTRCGSTIGEQHGPLPHLPAHRRRDRRQGLHRRPRLGRPAGAGRGDRARRLRVPGPEVLGGEPRLRAAARSGTTCATAIVGDDRRDQAWATSRDFRNFMGAVIDKKAFDKHLRLPRRGEAERDDRRRRRRRRRDGLLRRADAGRDRGPGLPLLCEEIFGPVVTAYVYDDAKWAETLQLVDETSPYALTGAVFAHDRARGPRRRRRRCATPPATSTSTTSPPARSSASSRSAARAARAPTTRRARS